MLKTVFPDTGGSCLGSSKPQATISVQASHWATVWPPVPGLDELFMRCKLAFEASGPLGHSMRAVVTDELTGTVSRLIHDEATGGVVRKEYRTFPQGMVPDVTGWLHEFGYDVALKDHRKDSPRWKLADGWKEFTPKSMRMVVKAVGAAKALRVIASKTDLIVETIAAVAVAYPTARIAVAVWTKKQFKAILKRLLRVFRAEQLGIYTARVKIPDRVSVGMIQQLPRGDKGAFDLLILPYAVETVGVKALEVATSGQFLRILSFSPSRWTPDENINRRLMVVAGSTFPPEKAKIPVTVVVLGTHGTKPIGKFENKLEEKRDLYWQNTRRNRRIAHVAKQLALARKSSVSSVTENEELARELLKAAKHGVCILVEMPEHAAELAKLLPGWAVWTASDLVVEQPAAKCGVIATEMGAAVMGDTEMVMSAGVMIRATGTKWPFPKTVDWPCEGEIEHGVLIDFADEYHPKAFKYAKARIESYETAGTAVWVPNNTVAAKE